MNDREIIQTEDGSCTLFVPGLNEHYHSIYGAIQEAGHIFIEAGLKHCPGKWLSVLEAGFGTGLNAYLSLLYADKQHLLLQYHSLEKYPLSETEVAHLNYPSLLPANSCGWFNSLHSCPWEEEVKIHDYFYLHKHQTDFREICFTENFDIVFFDAFNPDVQPHLWTEEVLSGFYQALKPGGILVTYCVKGIVKRALRNLGFTLKRLPGPPGKREMLRATKPVTTLF